MSRIIQLLFLFGIYFRGKITFFSPDIIAWKRRIYFNILQPSYLKYRWYQSTQIPQTSVTFNTLGIKMFKDSFDWASNTLPNPQERYVNLIVYSNVKLDPVLGQWRAPEAWKEHSINFWSMAKKFLRWEQYSFGKKRPEIDFYDFPKTNYLKNSFYSKVVYMRYSSWLIIVWSLFRPAPRILDHAARALKITKSRSKKRSIKQMFLRYNGAHPLAGIKFSGVYRSKQPLDFIGLNKKKRNKAPKAMLHLQNFRLDGNTAYWF